MCCVHQQHIKRSSWRQSGGQGSRQEIPQKEENAEPQNHGKRLLAPPTGAFGGGAGQVCCVSVGSVGCQKLSPSSIHRTASTARFVLPRRAVVRCAAAIGQFALDARLPDAAGQRMPFQLPSTARHACFGRAQQRDSTLPTDLPARAAQHSHGTLEIMPA